MSGNPASDTQYGINIDKTAPTITWIDSPLDGASYYFGTVPAEPLIRMMDTLSGPHLYYFEGSDNSAGTHTIKVVAYDRAGNSYSEQRTYTVQAWTLKGFYVPVDMNGVFNVVMGGSTVPLKFEVMAVSTELPLASIVKSFVQTKVVCDTGAIMDEIEVATTGGTSLHYDITTDQFIQNWQTPKTPGVCYRVTVTTQDGSLLTAFFKLK